MINKTIKTHLIILICLTLILSLVGGTEYYFRDFVVHKALTILAFDGNPEFFKKPSLIPYLNSIVYGFLYVILHGFHIISNFHEYVLDFQKGFINIHGFLINFNLPSLIINAIFAAIGVVYTYLTSVLLMKKEKYALLAAFFLMTSFFWMEYSHHLTVDIPLASMCIVTVFYSIKILVYKLSLNLKNILILSSLTALTAACKYNGGIILLAPVCVCIFQNINDKNWGRLFKQNFYLIFFALIIFILINPFIIIDFKHFISDFLYEFLHASGGHFGEDDKNVLIFNLFRNLPNGFGILPTVIGISGLFLLAKTSFLSKKIKIAFLIFPITFFLLMGCSKLIFVRYMVPMAPFLAIGVAFFAFELFRLLNQQNTKCAKAVKTMFIVVFFGLFLINLSRAIHFINIFMKPDTIFSSKEILKELNVYPDNKKIYFTELFSNYFYEEDFLHQMPLPIKNDTKKYLYSACNDSKKVVPIAKKNNKKELILFDAFDIVILDARIYDRFIYLTKYIPFYSPYQKVSKRIAPSQKKYSIVAVTPFKYNKEEVPFDELSNTLRYRISKGFYVELYFKDKKLAHKFYKKCNKYKLKCIYSDDMNDGFYYQNLQGRRFINAEKQ
ncbi:MAG: glycosyltransferase family 39 protein [Candidatus Gastranaerophilales bacterium]|nr:glycosyltransferase family 39 protein [Candidatus Gastranaerophilales bacterium]